LRVILACAYIVVSVCILTFSLSVQLYAGNSWYAYLLVGGGGPCINSIVLVLQLFVLRAELLKERPYTPRHAQFLALLALVSTTRFIYITVTNDGSPDCLGNLALAALLMTISMVQLAYWIVKRQSLPKFMRS
jgi:hypothetical protein